MSGYFILHRSQGCYDSAATNTLGVFRTLVKAKRAVQALEKSIRDFELNWKNDRNPFLTDKRLASIMERYDDSQKEWEKDSAEGQWRLIIGERQEPIYTIHQISLDVIYGSGIEERWNYENKKATTSSS